MTKEQIHFSYKLATRVYNKSCTLKEAKDEGQRMGINPNSMNYYCASYRHMLNGTIHKGSIGAEIRDYFLQEIFKSFDNDIIKNALSSFKQTIAYQEEIHNNAKRTKDRVLFEKYSEKLYDHE